RTAQDDDLVPKAIEEVRHVQRRTVSPKALLHAKIEGDTLLGLEVRIVGESQFEAIGRANARAKAAVQARPAGPAALPSGLAREISHRQARIHLNHRTRGQGWPYKLLGWES